MKRLSFARYPLRVRLVVAVLLLVAAGFTTISVVGVNVLRGQLVDRTDTQLRAMVDDDAESTGGGPLNIGWQAGTVVYRFQVFGSDGVQVQPDIKDAANAGDMPVDPDVPEDPDWLDEHAGRAVTVPAISGVGNWRVLVLPISETVGWRVVATPLDEVDATISNLIQTDLAVGAVGLLVLAFVGVVVVRSSLRPLVKVERTAAAIAAGDLSQRVPEHPPQTELGQLSHALNSMLTQVEEAFAAQRLSESSARQSEERMRRFVSDAGHELRTPLSVVRAWAEYSRHGPQRDSADLERILSTVGTEATRMSALVDDLLLLARLDQQRPLERHPVDMLDVVVDAARDARLLAPGRDIHLTVDDRGPYVVNGDENRLRQVVSNLTSNALTHTPPATPVSIELGPGCLDGKPALVLDVVDKGNGLQPEQKERVFERFYRTDTSRTRSTGGSGLGLSIVASLTAAHEGTATVHSSPGAGATFRLTLPLADAGPCM